MAGALYFHVLKTGLEGFPLGTVPTHQYAFETSVLYLLIFALFTVQGGGAISVDGLARALKDGDGDK